jgi:uncharacterized protein YuzE
MIKKKPIVRYDNKVDALYIVAKKGAEEEFVEVAPGVSVEMNEQGDIIGIEILNASKVLRSVFRSFNKLETVKV